MIFKSLLIGFCFSLQAQKGYQPSAENIQAREWFKEARFGLFVHWGVYSILGDGEWVMNNQNISKSEYEKLPNFFNPVAFDPEEWVSVVKQAGMKYITITSRHHDGFSMFHSTATEYNIVDATPYGNDILKQLAEACHKEGIKLFFYYSLLDWNRDDYYPRGRTGKGISGRGKGNWDDYISFMKSQLTELLTHYGPIGGIWFDGHWDQKEWDGKQFGQLKVDWHYDEIYSLIHQLQPQALIGNNHHLGIIEGEDFQMFEKDLPGKNTTGWGTPANQIGSVPLEVCETINGSWGFNLQDRKHKSTKELIQYLVKAAGYGSNLLLNVGPMPNGKIQEEHKQSLIEIGDWLKVYGESIYGTDRGPIAPNEAWVSTQKGSTVYLHLLDETVNYLHLDPIPVKIKSIRLFNSEKKLKYIKNALGITIDLNSIEKKSIDTVIVIEIF
ncbi:MAG: alpha-L-fucosidase [Flavobacteriaceae bacterium]